MRNHATLAPGLFLIITISLGIANEEGQITFSTPEQIKEDADLVPCQNDERLNAVQALFEKMGAQGPDISLEKFENVQNLSVRKPGGSPELVVVGAHYDMRSEGCGTVDNWSGIVAVAHVYKTVRNLPLNKTVLFVAFGKEEKGLMGSKAMVQAIGKDGAAQCCAMINLDSLGLGVPQVATNLSSKKLVVRAADLAKDMKMPFGQGSVPGDSDSSSFIRRKIPAITIHSLAGEYWRIIHTRFDQASKVNATSIYLGYRLALALLVNLDNSACESWR